MGYLNVFLEFHFCFIYIVFECIALYNYFLFVALAITLYGHNFSYLLLPLFYQFSLRVETLTLLYVSLSYLIYNYLKYFLYIYLEPNQKVL